MGFTALVVVVLATIVIWKACDYFEMGSGYLGRNMPDGIRGATINAIGSSLPELMTGLIFISAFNEEGGFSAAVATCAGSAVFNMVVIPALVILVVTFKSRIAPFVSLSQKVLVRDGAVFLAAEVLLILLLGLETLHWWMGLILMGVYVVYFSILMVQVARARPDPAWGEPHLDRHLDDKDEEDHRDMTTGRAWKLLAASSAVIGVACYGLCWSVVELSASLGVPAFLTAVVFAAAATSVPDTVLSVKDALAGEYDDAVANAVGSNIFDITICLGLPLMIACLLYGDIDLSQAVGDTNVQTLRIGLLTVTIATLGMLLNSARQLTTSHGLCLMSIFAVWIGFLTTFT